MAKAESIAFFALFVACFVRLAVGAEVYELTDANFDQVTSEGKWIIELYALPEASPSLKALCARISAISNCRISFGIVP